MWRFSPNELSMVRFLGAPPVQLIMKSLHFPSWFKYKMKSIFKNQRMIQLKSSVATSQSKHYWWTKVLCFLLTKNQTNQTTPSKPYFTKLDKSNLTNQTYLTEPTKPILLLSFGFKSCCAFGNALNVIDSFHFQKVKNPTKCILWEGEFEMVIPSTMTLDAGKTLMG